jgi:hypothetical protein
MGLSELIDTFRRGTQSICGYLKILPRHYALVESRDEIPNVRYYHRGGILTRRVASRHCSIPTRPSFESLL